MDAKKMLAWRSFLEAHAFVTRILDQELRSTRDLPLAWYDALLQLHEAGGTLRMHELADRLLLSRSATTRFADRLERAGLIERRQSAEDRRGTEVMLTGLGERTLREAAPLHVRGIEAHFAEYISDDEARCLIEVMKRIALAGG